MPFDKGSWHGIYQAQTSSDLCSKDRALWKGCWRCSTPSTAASRSEDRERRRDQQNRGRCPGTQVRGVSTRQRNGKAMGPFQRALRWPSPGAMHHSLRAAWPQPRSPVCAVIEKMQRGRHHLAHTSNGRRSDGGHPVRSSSPQKGNHLPQLFFHFSLPITEAWLFRSDLL